MVPKGWCVDTVTYVPAVHSHHAEVAKRLGLFIGAGVLAVRHYHLLRDQMSIDEFYRVPLAV